MSEDFPGHRIFPYALWVDGGFLRPWVNFDDTRGKTFLEFLCEVWRNRFRGFYVRKETV